MWMKVSGKMVAECRFSKKKEGWGCMPALLKLNQVYEVVRPYFFPNAGKSTFTSNEYSGEMLGEATNSRTSAFRMLTT